MKNSIILICIYLVQQFISAQNGFQNIRGKVKDNESEQFLSYVSIGLLRDTVLVQSTQSDELGNFEFKEIVPGRYVLKAYFTGYKSLHLVDVIVISGKETLIDILMQEDLKQLAEVTINASFENRAVNEMILSGGRVFSVEETNRYAGSRGDPARMAACFAGTQSTDDSRNDLVIRGNSPLGLLWRIQDVDIQNPNHFAIPGTTGGAISILNNKMFNNSDFLIGAFPAEYGNCNAGVFDIKLRNGNNERHEGTLQFGFLGTEFALEDPLSKKLNATYLITYRYSTLKLFEALKIKIGTDAVPNYQDASFKLNFPFKNGDNFSFFGIGATSKIDIILSKFDEPSEELYGENNKDQYFGSSMGIVGATYTKSIKLGLFLKGTISQYFSSAFEKDFDIYRNSDYKVDSLVRKLGYEFKSNKTAFVLNLQDKINSKNLIKAGIHIDLLHHDLIDSIYLESGYAFLNRIQSNEQSTLMQAYTQWKHKLNPAVETNLGIHMQYYTLNKQTIFEPRFSIHWNFDRNQSLSAGLGMHSQLQPFYIYFYKIKNVKGSYEEQNRNLGLSKSFHSTIAYELSISNNLRLKLEAYYIRLYEIPVNSLIRSSYSVINEGAEFGRFFPGKLENTGTGYNNGIECTLEKTFSSGYYYLLSSSLFESKYKGSDGVLRNTAYNANYSLNTLMGKEFSISKKGNKMLTVGTKISVAGGHRYSPPDIQASKINGELVIIDSLRNSLQFKNYFRLDVKLGYKINTKKVTHEIGIDLVNALDTKNILALVYSPDPRNPNDNPIKEEYQLGLLPLFYYKLDFTLSIPNH